MPRASRTKSLSFALRAMLWAGCALLSGCASNPRGDVATFRTTAHDIAATAPIAAPRGRVILLRGWMGLSPGLDPLAARLRSEGFDAVVFRHGQWPEIAATLRQPGWSHRPLILIGHSYGADAAISIAEDLTRHRGQVDLLITLDPCLPPPVPESVKVCRNFYRSNGLRDILPVFRGVAVRPTAGARVDLANFDLHGDRRDLLEADTDHFKITSNTRVNEAILREVRAACETATLVASTP